MRVYPPSDVSGFLSGFRYPKNKPDTDLAFVISGLDPVCRVCRVHLGGERPREIGNFGMQGRLAHNTLIRLDLNNARD